MKVIWRVQLCLRELETLKHLHLLPALFLSDFYIL